MSKVGITNHHKDDTYILKQLKIIPVDRIKDGYQHKFFVYFDHDQTI